MTWVAWLLLALLLLAGALAVLGWCAWRAFRSFLGLGSAVGAAAELLGQAVAATSDVHLAPGRGSS